MRSLLTKLGFSAAALVGAFGLAWGTAEAPWAEILQEPPAVRILFLGDMMLDRGVARRAAGDGTALVSGMQELVRRNDLVVLNLEGTITDHPSIAAQNNKILRFTFDPLFAQSVLRALGTDVVSLANNHALDFYAAGYGRTREYLDSFGVKHMGHPLNSQNISTIVEHGGMTLCFVGYHELYDPDTTSVISEIGHLRPLCSQVIVMTHWGVEYEPLPNDSQIAKGRAFIDAGADMVIGGHPHVVQPVEMYSGKPIFYSLGNFIFDQDFSWGTQHGLAVEAHLGKAQTHFSLVPLAIVESRPVPAEGEDARLVIEAAGGLDSIELP